MSSHQKPIIGGVILAGGLSRRMGGRDKCLLTLKGKSLLQYTIDCLQPQVNSLIINANGDPQRFANLNLPVVPDSVEGFAGPLAGILAALQWTRQHHPQTDYLVSVAADTPFIPTDLAPRLLASLCHEKAQVAVACSGGTCHQVIGLWPINLCDALQTALTAEHIHKVEQFATRYSRCKVTFANTPIDPFFNINTPQDLCTAEQIWELYTTQPPTP